VSQATISTLQLSNTETPERIRIRMVQILAALSLLRAIFPGSLVIFTIEGTAIAPALIVTISLNIIIYSTWVVLSLYRQTTIVAYGLILTHAALLFLPHAIDRLTPIIAVITIATLIEDWRVFGIFNLIIFGILSYLFSIQLAESPTFETITKQFYLVAIIGIVSITIRYFLNSIKNTLAETGRNANLLRIGAEVGQITVGLVSLDELLPNAVEFIRDRFSFYHVQIFLVDEAGSTAILRASTGEVGKKLLDRNHQLNVGSNSVIGRVTQTGEPVIARDTDRAGVHYRNELLPNTRAELALPIRDGEKTIGALDVQSTRPNAFQPSDVQALQIMTNLLATSIRNAQLFEEQRQNSQENQRLYIEAEANLREIQRLNRQLTKQGWDRYMRDLGESTGVVIEGNRISRTSEWSDLLTQAEQTRQLVSGMDDDGTYHIAVPIILRGEVIGAMEIEPAEELDETDTAEIIRAVSNRFAISLDNARLFEESQETSTYEQRINSIVGQIQNANHVDDLLQIALAELSETLGAKHGAIRLTGKLKDETPLTPERTNGTAGDS
jgi:GAF domain-containing protein